MMSLSISSASEREGNLLVDNLIPKLSILIFLRLTALARRMTDYLSSRLCSFPVSLVYVA